MPINTDLDLTEQDVTALGSVDAVASFFTKLGYDTSDRAVLTPEAIGLAGDSAKALKRVELLSEDAERLLRVVFAQPKSLTAKVRNDLARVLGKSTIDHVLVLSPDFDSLEFVFLDKRRKESKGPAGIERVQVVPKTIGLDRRRPSRLDLRTLRRFTWTCRDALDQFDKLRSVFEAAAYTGEYFQNRGLFSDYFLRERLCEDDAWRHNPSDMFAFVRDLMQEAGRRWNEKEEAVVRKELYDPVFDRLGFKAKVNRPATSDHTKPDYLLRDASGKNVTAAFVYPWERWLDGPDLNDPHTPDENPGACVVTALDDGLADWIIVTNGRQWRLYGRKAHARSTNFYEVDLVEALTASGDTDPNEAFRYWWLFFRPEAFQPAADDEGCWLDRILQGSRDYAKRLGDRLKDRVFFTIFPHMAQGFLEDRKHRLGVKKAPTREELDEVFEATLTLLYRLLFLLFAESRDLLPIREAPYQAASLKKIKEEIAEKAGVAESEVADALKKAYSPKETGLYDRLGELCKVLADGESVLNVPKYNGGLFNVEPKDMEKRDERIARFLLDHKIPDRHLALAIDRLARDQDERTLGLVFIDYKSLEVRHLGSIYEGLLEFKLKIAEEDLTTKTSKGAEKYVSLSQASGRRRQPDVVVRKNDVYLSNDKAERKASGSYYTPDDIVEYIVANTLGHVLDEKLEALRPEFRKVRKTFDNELKKSEAYPSPDVRSGKVDHRQWATQQTYNHHKDLVEKLFDLKACDPAMGSGHFLVEVVDFVTDRLVKFLNQFPINPVNVALERTRDSILESLGEQGVTVEPANLTDINLLKRFVLKRCVYGVDLNPMAVELAKVSLWLDCFTLGAPLNFLDHHLRCGNSLVGATFKDLEDATQGRLFSLNFEPLLRAINHVLQVSRLADATAADVAQSMKQYDTARQALTGYQVILDLLVAKHFGFPEAPSIVEQGDNIDLTNRDRFLKSLHDDDERSLVRQVEEVAQQRDRRFFHWEIEFPEIFFGVIGANGQHVKHKDVILKGTPGFDCVIGNPPYVRMEVIKPLKSHLKSEYACHSDRADLFVYFHERALTALRTGGQMGFIAASNWIKTAAGRNLREFLLRECALQWFVDLADCPVFEDASTYPSVLVARKSPPKPTHTVSIRSLRTLQPLLLRDADSDPGHTLAQNRMSGEPWNLGTLPLVELCECIANRGRLLGDHLGAPLYGVKTGCNDAFVLDEGTRQQIVTADPGSDTVIRPFLEGSDIRPWQPLHHHNWVIYTPKGTNIDEYPGIADHLERYRERLESRATQQEWFELQQAQARYSQYFEQPKIVYSRFVNRPLFALDREGCHINNAISAIPTDDVTVLFCLMSPVSWLFLHTYGAPMANGYRQIHGHVVERVPLPQFTQSQTEAIVEWHTVASKNNVFNDPPWQIVYDAFDLTTEDISLLEQVSKSWK